MSRESNPHEAPGDRLGEVAAEYLAALERGESPDRDALLAAHPDLADQLRAFFADHDRMRDLVGPAGAFPELTGPYQNSPAPAESDPVGAVVAGRYKLLQRIGE